MPALWYIGGSDGDESDHFWDVDGSRNDEEDDSESH